MLLIPAYLVVIVVACYFFPLEGTEAPGEIHLIHFTSNFVSTFPVQVFAYTCAQNVRPSHSPSDPIDDPFGISRPAHFISYSLFSTKSTITPRSE